MEQYIDKAAVVAEINRVLNSYDPNEITSGRYALVDLRNFLDTIEVKEIDMDELLSYLDKDIKEFVTTEEFERDSAIYGHYWVIAKHAFLLGLRIKLCLENLEAI